MKRIIKALVALLVLIVAAAGAYGAIGYRDALSDADALSRRADALIAGRRAAEDLGEGRKRTLLLVQDPAFRHHEGVDFTSPGAGMTTVTQSLVKRLAFDEFKSGIRKIRQTGYAMGLEQELTKDQILALWLDTVEMGRGPDGWMTGFFEASEAIYGMPPDDLPETQFLSLVAVLIAPGALSLLHPEEPLNERVSRIERLVAGKCIPNGHGDVWLEGCSGQ
ncbi:glycosyl transferase [Rhodobacterales bacterium]|nr:glycosyl transferase [Rhodobacterales bacterium]